MFKASRSAIRDRFPSASSLQSSVSSSSLSSGYSSSMSPTSSTTASSSKGFASKSNSFSSFLPSLNNPSAVTSNCQQQYHMATAAPSEHERNSFSNLQFVSELYRNDFDSDDEAKLTKKQVSRRIAQPIFLHSN